MKISEAKKLDKDILVTKIADMFKFNKEELQCLEKEELLEKLKTQLILKSLRSGKPVK